MSSTLLDALCGLVHSWGRQRASFETGSAAHASVSSPRPVAAVLRHAGRSAALSGLADAAAAGADAIHAYRQGKVSGQEAIAHTLREGATGAIAGGIGTLAAGALAAATGGAVLLPMAASMLVSAGVKHALG